MKKNFWIFTLLLMVCFVSISSAQTAAPPIEQITVNVTDLTADQYAKIKADQLIKETAQKIETYGQWVGVGGEIGTAIKDGLNAVVDVSERFGDTNVGQFTMYLVAWKVVGKDLVRIALGLLLGLIATVFIFRSFRVYCTRKVRIKGAWWQFWVTKEYAVVTPKEFDGIEFLKWSHWVMLVVTYGIVYAIMFAG